MPGLEYYLYIIANVARTLDVASRATSIVAWRSMRMGSVSGFTSKHQLDRLVGAEATQEVILREKQLEVGDAVGSWKFELRSSK